MMSIVQRCYVLHPDTLINTAKDSVNKSNSVHNLFLAYLFLVYFLRTFWATTCPSSGETTVFMRHLVLVILCKWLVCRSICSCIPDSHPHRITSTNTIVSPDDGHIVARNVWTKYTKNKLCTELPLFTRLYRDAQSTKLKYNTKIYPTFCEALTFTSLRYTSILLKTNQLSTSHTSCTQCEDPSQLVQKSFQQIYVLE